MGQTQQKARTRRALVQSASLHQLKQLFTQGLHLRYLLFSVRYLTQATALVLTPNICMATHHSLNTTTQRPVGENKQLVDISIRNAQLPVLVLARVQQGSADTVNNSIPLGTPSDPEVAAKPGPKANQAGDKTHDASIRVDPSSEFSWLHWLSFWGLCLFLGFALSQIIAPRQK